MYVRLLTFCLSSNVWFVRFVFVSYLLASAVQIANRWPDLIQLADIQLLTRWDYSKLGLGEW